MEFNKNYRIQIALSEQVSYTIKCISRLTVVSREAKAEAASARQRHSTH